VNSRTLFVLIILAAVGCTSIPEVETPKAEERSYPMVGKTYLHYDPMHGYQVEYFNNDTTYLWYPGNPVSLEGKWKISFGKICNMYPQNSYNKITNRTGGNYECSSIKTGMLFLVGELDGDMFGLSSGRVPYVLSRCTPPPEFKLDTTKKILNARCKP